MSEDDLSKSRTSVPVLRYAAADIVKQHTTELARSASVSSGVSSSKINTPVPQEELKVEDHPADSPRSDEMSASEKDNATENIFENRGGFSLTQSTPIPIATAQDIVRLSDSLSSSAPESFNDSSPVSLSTLSTRQRSHSTGTAISQDELERRVLFDAFSANKGAGAEKLHKFFGMPIAFESFVSVAPQPRHVKEYKMKKIFGEEIPLEHRAGIKKSMDDVDIKYMSESQKHRRVGKFFGESLDVSEPSSLQEPFGLSRRVSRMLQPEHVDVGKLNKFFGRPTYIQKEKEDEQEGQDEDSSAMERQQIQQQLKKSRKLRNYFGESQPVIDPNAKQFAPQPAHVKGYKLSKHFGCHVAIEHGTESKSNTNSPPESLASSNSNTNSSITVDQPNNNTEPIEEPVIKRELLLFLPDRTLDSSPRTVSASDSGTRSARKASKILGESLTPKKKDLANSHREPLYKEGGKKSHRDKDKDKNKDKIEDREDEPKEHKEKEHKKKKEDKN